MPNFTLSGQYQLTLTEQGEVVYQSPWFTNLITDVGMDRIATGEYLTWCAVGEGTAEPAFSDTALQTLVLATDAVLTTTITPGAIRRVFLFSDTASSSSSSELPAVAYLTEVGVGWQQDGLQLFSRTLLPEVVPLVPGQELTVAYELTLSAPLSDDIYALAIGGETVTVVNRAALIDEVGYWGVPGTAIAFSALSAPSDGTPQLYDGPLGGVTEQPTGSGESWSTVTAHDYLPGSHYVELEATWERSVGNFTEGATATLYTTNGYGAYQTSFDPPLAKTADNILHLTYQVGWVRCDSGSSSSSSSSS